MDPHYMSLRGVEAGRQGATAANGFSNKTGRRHGDCHQSVIPLRQLGILAVFMTAACGMPSAMLRPPVPMPEGAHHEFSGGGVVERRVKNVFGRGGKRNAPENIGAGLLSYSYHKKSNSGRAIFDIGFTGAGGPVGGFFRADVSGEGEFVSILAANFRLHLLDEESFQLALDVDAGVWTAIGLPFGVRLFDGMWFYIAPAALIPWPPLGLAFLASSEVSYRLPAGLSVNLGEQVLLVVEGGWEYLNVGTAAYENRFSGPYYYGSVGVAYRPDGRRPLLLVAEAVLVGAAYVMTLYGFMAGPPMSP